MWMNYSPVHSGYNCGYISNEVYVIPLPETFYLNDILHN